MRYNRYSKEEQFAIGKEIYDGHFTIGEAAIKKECINNQNPVSI